MLLKYKALKISWNEVKIYFQGYLSARKDSEDFNTTKIPMLTVDNFVIFAFHLDTPVHEI